MHQSIHLNPPTKELHLCLSSLSHVGIVPPASRSVALPAAYASPFITGTGKGDGERRWIQVNSQPERFHDYSLFIPVVCPCCGVDSERDACLCEREEPGLMSTLVVMRLGATIHHTQETHSNQEQAGSFSRSQDEKKKVLVDLYFIFF